MLIAAVVNYTDNIVKGLSNCLSMVLSCIDILFIFLFYKFLSFELSKFLFNFSFTWSFLIGATLVLIALMLYNFNGINIKNNKA